MEHNLISRPRAVAFLKYLEKSGLIVTGVHHNDRVIETTQQVCGMSDEDFRKSSFVNMPSANLIQSEYGDWNELNPEN